MAKRTIKAGVADQTVDVFIMDSTSTSGAGLSGLVYNSSGLKCYYRKGATGAATALTLATQTVGGAHSDGGFVEIDATNMKGVYRLDLSDTIVAATPWVTIYLYGATNMAPVVLELEVVSVDPFDTVRYGLTALPNAAAEAAGGLYTRGTGAGQINQDANGRIDANLKAAAGTNVTLDANNALNVSTKYVGGTLQTAGDLASMITAVDDYVDTEVAAVKAKTDNLPASFPTNFASLAITVGGAVTAGTVSDKTGYSLSQAFPANFSALGINVSGHISRVTLADTITTYTGDTPQTGDSYAKVNDGTIGLAAIKGYVDDIGVAGAGLTALGDTRLAYLDAAVSTRLAAASYTAPDNASVTAVKAKTDNLPVDPADASDIAAAFGTVNSNLSTVAGYIDTEVAAIKAVTDKLNTALVLDGAVYQFTTNALELGPAGGGGGGGGSGPGADQVTLTINDETTGDPIPDAQVWITSDVGGLVTVAGYDSTNADGEVVFMLDNGASYYLWMQKDGHQSIRARAFTAVAD